MTGVTNDGTYKIRSYSNVIAASIAGCTTVIAGFPFDSIKTRMQTYSYDSFLDCARQTVRREGVAGLFRGLTSPLLGFTSGRTLSFAVYDNSKQWITNHCDEEYSYQARNTLASFAGGGIAGMAVSVISSPLELIKIQRQLQELVHQENPAQVSLHDWKPAAAEAGGVTFQRAYFDKPVEQVQGSTMDTARQIYRKRGWRGFYFGYHLQLPREIYGTSVYFGMYESIKYALSSALPSSDWQLTVPETAVYLLSGAFSGVVTWTLIFPLDLIKSKIQKNVLLETATGTKMQVIKQCIAKVYRQNGLRGFYSGYSATVLRAIPVHSLNWIIYEKVKKYCEISTLL